MRPSCARVYRTGRPYRGKNRVTPFGEIVAVSERGMVGGNRGVVHDDDSQGCLQTGRAFLLLFLSTASAPVNSEAMLHF
jgi:hypothetical protein